MTPTQNEVLEKLAGTTDDKGRVNIRKAAEQLELSPNTVKNHLKGIKKANPELKAMNTIGLVHNYTKLRKND